MKVLKDNEALELKHLLEDALICVGIVKLGEPQKFNLFAYCSQLEIDMKRFVKKLGRK